MDGKMELPTRVFGVVDYVVFGALILVSIAIGIFFAYRDKSHNTSANYFLGGRKMKALPLAISYVVTFQSSIMMLGSPAEIYAYGLQYAVQVVGVMLAFMLAAMIVVPLFHPLDVTSIYEYYYLRYNTNLLRYFGVVLGVSYYTLYMGVVMFGTALALQATAGLPLWISILIFSSASVIYTSIGGIKAVIWTDVFQSTVMFAGILAVLIKSCISTGGIEDIREFSKSRFNGVNFHPDPTIRNTFWTLVLGAVPQFFYVAITQAGVQRIISTPSVGVAKRMMYIAAPIYCIVWLVVMFEGIAVFAYYSSKGCDPLTSGKITNPNQIIPFTILEMFHNFHGMPGLFIAALAAASLSTISSGLSGLAAVSYVDFLRVWKPRLEESKGTNISKTFVVLYGVLSAVFAFMMANIKGPLGEIMVGFTSSVAGPETGMFLVSVFFRRSRPKVVFVAAVLGLILNLWLVFGQSFTADLPKTPYLPPGPTTNCTNDLVVQNISYATYGPSSNDNSTIFGLSVKDFTTTGTVEPDHPVVKSKSGLNWLYSISYMYFHLIGTVFTIVIAVIGSLLAPGKELQSVNPKCILPLTVLIPGFLRRLCSSSKYQVDSTVEGESDAMIGMRDNQIPK